MIKMSKTTKTLAKETLLTIFDDLSDEKVAELLDFAEFLLSKTEKTELVPKSKKNPILEIIGIADAEPFADRIDDELYAKVFGDDLIRLIRQLDKPLPKSIRELIVLELYRQARISSGKAGQLLGMNRFEFIRYASRLGIPYFEMTEDEWETEKRLLENL